MDKSNLIGTFGICNAWAGRNDSRPPITGFELYQVIAQCYGIADDGWLKVRKLSNKKYEIKPNCFMPIPNPQFLPGDLVFVPQKSMHATIQSVYWHFKMEKHMYFLIFKGKESSRRYFIEELEKSCYDTEGKDITRTNTPYIAISTNKQIGEMFCFSTDRDVSEIWIDNKPIHFTDLLDDELRKFWGGFVDREWRFPLKSKRFRIYGKIKAFDCSFSTVTKVDISENQNLEMLCCNNNLLGHLTISDNKKLKYLSCSKNKLRSLDIRENQMLECLFIDNNHLKKLYILENKKLERLYCNNNKLKCLDISKSENLKCLHCENNKLSYLGAAAEKTFACSVRNFR